MSLHETHFNFVFQAKIKPKPCSPSRLHAPPGMFRAASFVFSIEDWRRTTERRRSAIAPADRKRPSRRARASSAQTLAPRAPPEFAGTPQSAPETIRDREVLPDSRESNSLSLFSAAPATAPRAARLPSR